MPMQEYVRFLVLRLSDLVSTIQMVDLTGGNIGIQESNALDNSYAIIIVQDGQLIRGWAPMHSLVHDLPLNDIR
ncbi:unnamed protein product [Absidia cylindrospora]